MDIFCLAEKTRLKKKKKEKEGQQRREEKRREKHSKGRVGKVTMSMITTSAWVRRGMAAQFPTKYEIDENEMNRISELARMQLEDAKEDLSTAQDGNEDEGAMDEDQREDGKDGSEDKAYVCRNSPR